MALFFNIVAAGIVGMIIFGLLGFMLLAKFFNNKSTQSDDVIMIFCWVMFVVSVGFAFAYV